MEEQSETAERIDPISLFPEEMRQGVQDLTYLGYLTQKVSFCGHTFTIETLRPYVRYAVSQALEPWRNTIREPEIWAALHVGMAVTGIDGNNSYCPPTSDSLSDFVEARLRWWTGPQGYWQPTIDYLFGELVTLEQRSSEMIVELHRLSQGGRGTSQPSPDSLIVLGLSGDKTVGDTPATEPSS